MPTAAAEITLVRPGPAVTTRSRARREAQELRAGHAFHLFSHLDVFTHVWPANMYFSAVLTCKWLRAIARSTMVEGAPNHWSLNLYIRPNVNAFPPSVLNKLDLGPLVHSRHVNLLLTKYGSCKALRRLLVTRGVQRKRPTTLTLVDDIDRSMGVLFGSRLSVQWLYFMCGINVFDDDLSCALALLIWKSWETLEECLVSNIAVCFYQQMYMQECLRGGGVNAYMHDLVRDLGIEFDPQAVPAKRATASSYGLGRQHQRVGPGPDQAAGEPCPRAVHGDHQPEREGWLHGEEWPGVGHHPGHAGRESGPEDRPDPVLRPGGPDQRRGEDAGQAAPRQEGHQQVLQWLDVQLHEGQAAGVHRVHRLLAQGSDIHLHAEQLLGPTPHL
eukprot:52657-Hanusia_phi.AAC.3